MTANEEFSADEEMAIQDALHDPIEVEDNDHYDECESEGFDSPQEEQAVVRMTNAEEERVIRNYYGFGL